MTKIFSFFTMALMLSVATSKAQLTAMDFYGMDCNGSMHNMFSELDAGKAVVLFFYMPSCGSCPPPAQKIQTMANNILASYPNMITAYAFPFQNSTTCAYSSTWTSSNGLSLYSPMDSGATQVAYYGGFGMPTVVLLGGIDHRVMFSTLAFNDSDTTIMRDSILALFGVAPAGIHDNHLPSSINSLNIFPNPATNHAMIVMDLNEATNLVIDVIDITGRQVAVICNEKSNQGSITKHFNTEALANGTYTIRINANGKFTNKKLNVVH
ncbi:MAG: T9SS type A sorting domain-containing protein [Bacteroidetes bacterium]|nr:T9SS type A sorting domain-containing protein [Bacteroidota bacterium]